MGISLNRSDLAAHMGVSEPTVDRWIKEGMPVVRRGGRGVAWEFDLPEVVKWWGDRRAATAAGDKPSDLAEIEKRTALAKMEQAELATAKVKGEVAPLIEFERAQARMMAAIRQNIMNVPQRAVLQLLGETDEATFKKVLRTELSLALETAAQAEFDLEDEDDTEGNDD